MTPLQLSIKARIIKGFGLLRNYKYRRIENEHQDSNFMTQGFLFDFNRIKILNLQIIGVSWSQGLDQPMETLPTNSIMRNGFSPEFSVSLIWVASALSCPKVGSIALHSPTKTSGQA